MSRMRLREIIGKPLTGEWGNEDLTGTGVPVLRTTNFTNDGIISFDNVVTRDISPNRLNDKWLKHGDIIIEKSGGSDRQPVGRVVYYVGENNAYTFNNFTSALRVQDQSHWNPKFVFYALFYNYAIGGTWKYENKTTGLHNLKLNLFVDKFAINWISVSEQNRIVAVIDAITHLISLRQRQAEKLDELVKARFVEMFGDPCEMLHWECKKIEEVADVTVGVVVKPANFYTDDRLHGVKAFRSLNIGEMKVKDNDWVYFSEEGNAQNAKSQLHEGDVLVVRSGAPGTSCVVTKAYEGCNAIDVIIVHVDGIKLNPYYLCAFNNFPHGMRQMLKGVGGAAQKHLNVGKYNQMIVAIPPMKLQNEFVLFMDSVDREKDRIQRSAALLETLKRSLMQQYFG